MGMGIKKYLAVILSLLLASPSFAQSGMGRTGAGGIGVPPPRAQMQGQSHARAFTKLIFDDGALVYNGSHVHVTTSAASPALVQNYVPYNGAIKDVNLGSQHLTADTVVSQHMITAAAEVDGNTTMYGSLYGYDPAGSNRYIRIYGSSTDGTITTNLGGIYVGASGTGDVTLQYGGGAANKLSVRSSAQEVASIDINGNAVFGPTIGGSVSCGPLYSDHQHPSYTSAHGEYVPYIGATKDLEMGSQHITADTVKANELIGAYLTSTIIGSMDMRADKWAITGVGLQASGDIESLSNIIGVNLIGKYDNQHAEYVPYSTYGVHQHPQYSSIIHQHDQYVALDQTTPQHIQGKPNITGIQFDTAPSVGAVSAGKLYWDSTYKTLSLNNDAFVNLQIGQESMIRVIAGEDIADGDVVYFSGSSGVFPEARKAIATSSTTARVKGIATEAIATGSEGLITNFGIIHDLNTNAFNAGDLVYLSAATAGAISATKPAPPNEQIIVGRVVVKDATVGSIYRSSSPNYPISSDQIDMQREATDEGATSKHSLQDWFNTYSVGMISGGLISKIGPSHVTVTAGTGISATGTSDTDPVAFIDWGFSQLTMTDARVNWIAVDYNNGSPHVQVHVGTSATDYSVPSDINYQNVWPLGYITKNGAELYLTNNPRRMQDAVGGLTARFYQTLPLARDEKVGGIILGETGTRNITLSAGILWDRQNQFTISAINTSTTGKFSTWYRDAGTGFNETENVTQWPNAAYDDGSGVLQTVAANRYANLWWYVSTEGYLAMMYGRAIYTSAAAASLGTAPSTLPLPLWAHFRLIGRTTFKGSDPTFIAIDSAFTNTFNPSATTTHNNLSGLQGGTTNEYYHSTSTENTAVTAYSPSFSFYDTQTKAYSQHQHPSYLAQSTYYGTYGIHTHSNYLATDQAYGKNTAHAEYTPYSVYGVHSHPNYSTGGYGINTAHPEYTPYSVYGIHSHPNYTVDTSKIANAHSEYTPYSVYGIHTHPNYLSYVDTSKIANAHAEYVPYSTYGVHAHPQYQVNGSVDTSKIANAHALATTSAAGFMPTLSNVATEYLNGTGSWSTPAGGGGGGTTIGSVPFQALAAPQALQGIEQLRHTASSYQNYGEIIVDGLVDETGTRSPSYSLTYSSVDDDYTLPSGDTYTKLLIHFNGADGATTYTAESGQTVTFDTTAQLDTAQKEFGTASLLLDGNSDFVSVPDSTDFDFGDNPFTIDVWFKLAGNNADWNAIYTQSDASELVAIHYYPDGPYFAVGFQSSSSWILRFTVPMAYDTNWHHVAWVRVNTDNADTAYRFFIDGVATAMTKTHGNWNATAPTVNGVVKLGTWSANYYWYGWIDEPRVSKNIARWTSDFSVPTSEYSIASSTFGYIHTLVYPMPITPTHLGVVVKMDDVFPTNDQHQKLQVGVSRDGVSFTDCHPITKIGTAGYYRAEMANVTGTGATGTAKITLQGGTTQKLRGYGIYGE